MLRFQTAACTLLVLVLPALVPHLALLAGLIPAEMVLAGRLAYAEQRTVGALVNIGFLLLFTALVLARIGLILRAHPAFGRWVILGIFALFAPSTVGDLLALDLRETLLFTPITPVGAVLSVRVVLGA